MMDTQAFSKIQPIQNAFLSGAAETEKGAPAGEKGIFADIFQTAIDNVKTTDADYSEAQYLLATGQLDNPAEMMIAMTKAHSSVDLLVQLRNKALDAYSEITRISI